MKIVLTANDVEAAVIRHLRENKNIKVSYEDITWVDTGITHPIHPIVVEIK